MTGKIELHVHYYEQGNVRSWNLCILYPLTNRQVQLITAYEPKITIPAPLASDLAELKPAAAAKIFAIIESEERTYQVQLTDSYENMKEKTFKNLRRALPLTRQKIDWDKVRTHRYNGLL
jgi:capping protein (actin filament) muscle Z-line, alpha